MGEHKKTKIAVLTGGGDAPGLNSVIYAFVRTCIIKYGYEVFGYRFGYKGLYDDDMTSLTLESTSGILHQGGTILFSSNKDNLFKYPKEVGGKTIYEDVSDTAVKNLKNSGIDALVILGGDGTLTSARNFARKGVNVIGIPKTIDNDLALTEQTFGFDTAVGIVTENLGRLHTTAASHHRVIVVEVMGRDSGWIALHSGIAGSADVILIPEIPFTLDGITKKIEERNRQGRRFSVVVVAEGAAYKDGEVVVKKIVENSPDPIRLGGIGAKIAYDLETRLIDQEVRNVVLGHIQRGGEPSAADRILSARYGYKAAELISESKFGNMVCLKDGKMSYESLENVIGTNKKVDPDGEMVAIAKGFGISFGN